MRFVLKALFFLAVVAAFIPRDGGAEAAGRAAPALERPPAPPRPSEPVDVVAEAESGICGRRPALCEAAEESAMAARIIGQFAVQSAQAAMAADETRTSEPQPGAPGADSAP